jgi:hypothetical protein
LQPGSALVAFAQTDDLHLIFETFVDTRKWDNLQLNPYVAFVMGWDISKYITMQYEGVATAVPTNEIEKYTRLFLAKDTPCTESFLRGPRIRLFTVKPTWIRYSDYTGAIPNIIEMGLGQIK